MPDKFSDFISCIVTAVSDCSLYSKEHPAVAEFCEKAVALLDELYMNDMANITLLGRDLVFNDALVTEKGAHMQNFIKKLRAKGIEKIIIKRGVDTAEMIKFISSIASRGEAPASTGNILIGTVQVRFRSEGIEVSAMMNENILKIKDVYHGLSRFKKLDSTGLEDAVLGFISLLKKEADLLRIVSPVKAYSEYTYVHAANVSVLTLFQAEALGLKGESLHDAGLAGLLHDVGKMFVSKEVIDKQAKLDDKEWTEMKKHPVYGALYLSTKADAPKVAVIAAFEHHMKFNGSGYPDTKRFGKKQHIISQAVAISDFFDALRTERPYRKALDLPVIVGLINESSGKDFNPLLVNNFLSALKKIRAL